MSADSSAPSANSITLHGRHRPAMQWAIRLNGGNECLRFTSPKAPRCPSAVATPLSWSSSPSSPIVALAMAALFRQEVLAAPEGTENMRSIGQAVQEGAQAYLTRQFKTLAVFAAIAFLLLFVLPGDAERPDRPLAVLPVRRRLLGRDRLHGHVPGGEGEHARCGRGPRRGPRPGDAGGLPHRWCVGMATVGLGLLGAAAVVLIYRDDAPSVLEGFGFGAALLAMFMRVGGGIFTKAADVGADLVGKVEQNIPEDDPRNAATIADNVGDNVGDCAGMAADLFESYAVTLVAALILGKVAFGAEGLVFPLIVPAIGAITAIIGVYITPAEPQRGRPGHHQPGVLHLGRHLGRPLRDRRVHLPAEQLRRAHRRLGRRRPDRSVLRHQRTPAPRATRGVIALVAVLIGIALAAVILALTGYFTGTEHRPVKDVGKTSLTGAATVILSGLSVGFESAVYTALVIGSAVYGAFLLGSGTIIVSLFAVALAGCGLLTTVGVIVAMDTFGPVSDNAQGIAEMSGDVDEEGAAILTELDAVGNTTKAITKGIAIATAVLAATALFGVVHRRGRSGATQELTGDVSTTSAPPRSLSLGGVINIVDPSNLVGLLHRRRRRVPVLRPGDQRRRPRRRRGRLRGASPVPRDPRDHGGHRSSGVRQGRRHLHPGLAARARHAGPAGDHGSDRGRLRSRRRPAGRASWPARSAPAR